MHQKPNSNREAGLTLVEILVSLVILGIVFVAFMTIFPQMTLFNSRTETKLETMNEARIVLEEYRNKTIQKTVLRTAACPNNSWTQVAYTGKHPFESNHTPIIKVKNCPDVKPADTQVKGVVQLHQILIEIQKNNRLISESFGYVAVE
ncbi:hypothetical protein NCCP2716_12950 [Sporosarcina sp. NCCP-2716]|uniref:PulJ/GspJ family protein n=1 Tax=Sporosarcina sp. NCCP-2716 TaxID=2943679 RepID=UPI00203C5799|nr:type II secretion system protein [Sporosarcina sp. NCCP-2716]GKV68797.1 hypothetical protein NCCP2716_12950 [Sporosarcina sp. NCCP-2716]